MDPFAHLGEEPRDIGVLPLTEESDLFFSLYWGAKRKIMFPEMEILLQWANHYADTPKAVAILTHIKEHWDGGNLAALRAIANAVKIEMEDTQQPMAIAA